MSWSDKSRCRWRNVDYATDTAFLRHIFLLLKSIPVTQTLAERSVLSPIMHLARRPRAFHILRRSLCLRRSPCGEDALEAFAVLQENKNPQHASDQSRR